MVANKFEIKGTLAFGGLGWIYLGLDVVLSRWVVLKGLLNAKDPNMVALAVREREFLAALKHRSVVGIYDFIAHGNEGFIVMEYVNGKTLMNLRKEKSGPLEVKEAISYILEVLPAFAYLDEMGLVYCDFKPENAMVEGDNVKLIDMGAVRRVDDVDGDIYGSKGYAAKEASDNPTPVSDLFSVARALAVLVADFDFQGKYEYTLPPAADVPIFQQHESLYRFLQKATREKPEERFQTAEEMGEQLVGVLRDVTAGSAELGQVESALFDHTDRREEHDEATHSSKRAHRGVPPLKVDIADAGANIILAASAVNDPAKRKAMYDRALKTFPDSMELKLRSIDEMIELEKYDQAQKELLVLEQARPQEWRLAWYRGRLLMAMGRVKETIAHFEKILSDLPGELAPKQALARAYELAGDLVNAIRYFDAVSRADPTFTSASFGLGRCLARKNERLGAAAAYARVPASSNRYARAQMERARVLMDRNGKAPTLSELMQASNAIESLDDTVQGLEIHQLRAELFEEVVESLDGSDFPPDEKVQLLGVALMPMNARIAAEGELRECAKYAQNEHQKIHFVDRANQIRPITLF